MALAETAELAVRISLKDNVSAGVGRLQRNLGGLSKSIGQVGKGFGQVGAGLTRAGLVVGGAAVAGITAAAKAGIEFEDAFAGVKKTVNETDLTKAGLSFEKLSTAFRDMATEIPISAVTFAELGETAGALGVKAQDIEEFVRVSALMGVTTNLSANDAADAFGRIGTILGLTGKEYAELADSIVAVGNAGASTESEITEITKRFAAQARLVGLNKEEMVGLASATASLGFEPERGGTALARVFANMSTNIALANAKGKEFSKITGRSITELQADLNRGKGLEIFQDFLAGIKGLSATDLAKTLKAAGITNTSDRTIFQTMSGELPFVNEQLEIAKNAMGALLAEATKKFATTASKIQLLKNNVIEAGIAFSEGFLPAVGRSIDKLIAFLKLGDNKSRITELGKDIGDSIDSIDWNAVLTAADQFVGILKGALSFAKLMYDAFSALPGPIKEATAGFLVLNKLSGGLIGAGAGNIVGGVAGAVIQGAASRAPGVGRLFAQPVFVTNFPPGFGVGGKGGPGVVGGGPGKLGNALGILSVVGSLVSVVGTQQEVARESTEQAKGLNSTLQEFLRQRPDETALKNALAGVEQGIRDLESNPLNVLVQGEALTELRSMRADIARQIANSKKGSGGSEMFGPPKPGTPTKGPLPFGPMAPGAVEAALKRGRLEGFFPTEAAGRATVEQGMLRAAEAHTAKLEAVRMEQVNVRSATQLVAANALRAGERTAGALSNIRPPIVNVDVNVSPAGIVHKFVTIRRSGPTGGSRERSGPLEF